MKNMYYDKNIKYRFYLFQIYTGHKIRHFAFKTGVIEGQANKLTAIYAGLFIGYDVWRR